MQSADPPPTFDQPFMDNGDWGVCCIVWEKYGKNSQIYIFRVIIENWGDDVTKMTLK